MKKLGAYDHRYETADVADVGGKHYVVHGYMVRPESDTVNLDDQHSDAKYFDIDALPSVHPNVAAYLDDMELGT